MINHTDEELLNAYIDNALPADKAEVVKQRLSSDLVFRRRYEQLIAANEFFKQQVAAIDQQPLPDGLMDKLSTAGQPKVSPSRPWYGIAAAAAVFAVVAPVLYQQLSGDSEFDPNYHASVQAALSERLSGPVHALDNGEIKLQITFSFVNGQGELCREYLYQHTQTAGHAVACFASGRWSNRVEANSDWLPESNQYQPASLDIPEQITQYLDQNMSSDALSQEQEQSLIDRSWARLEP